jgi:hypothetical protein
MLKIVEIEEYEKTTNLVVKEYILIKELKNGTSELE